MPPPGLVASITRGGHAVRIFPRPAPSATRRHVGASSAITPRCHVSQSRTPRQPRRAPPCRTRTPPSPYQAAVAAAATPSKTARQCRHKVEKLRRRLRSKRRRPCPILDGIDLLDDPSSSPSRSHSPSPPPPASPLPPSPSPPKKRRRPDPDEEGYYAGESDVVQAVRAIGEGFVRAELRRMEAARESQRMRMEMALRHLDAQRRLLDGLVGRIVDALE
ncbi:serine/arginine repetitive matrix protein 1 [Triticum aestivum]|uniref:serine/arginine repetitive matrix protein 1 n=1 Tax=Triticum aestivum TaxID=4565 RepID=UPI001D00BEBB|nr:serine/arginine repetitive matrix protein 1-like [Triticum aestivum]